MRRTLWTLFIVACGDDAGTMMIDGSTSNPDMAVTQCLPQGAVGQFYRRTPSPRLVAGGHTFSGGNVSTQLNDPDLLWDGALWHLYYSSPYGTFASPGAVEVRHATSPDLATWTFQATPSLAGALEPTVARTASGGFAMMYSDGSGSILATTSSDGQTFAAGSVALAPSTVYPGSVGARLWDPELVIVGSTYHLWFASADCATAPCVRQGIGHATSTDGTQWTLDSGNIPSLLRASNDPSTGGVGPAVVYDEPRCRWEMFLTNTTTATENNAQGVNLDNSAGLWRATSTNGTTWSINYSFARDFVWDGTSSGEHLGMRAGADVALKGTGRYMLYTGYDDQNVPSNSTLPSRAGGTRSAVMTLNLATRDAAP